MDKQYILIIKHGALGDMMIATAGFAAIRAAYPAAHIVCLTTRPYAELLAKSPYFNEIWIDAKPRIWDRAAIARLRTMLNSYRWHTVFDLQGSQRSTFYQWLIARPWPPISNISRLTKLSCRDPLRKTRHAFDNLERQLQIAGLRIEKPDISWIHENIDHLLLDILLASNSDASSSNPPLARYALLVPGGAPHRPAKRWPADHYAALAQELVQRKITPILIGTKAEEKELSLIASRVPQSVNLCGRTSITQLAELARGAHCAIGNDTGPMHVIAASECRCLVLFSQDSDPARCAPVGKVTTLRRPNLADLSVDTVLASLT